MRKLVFLFVITVVTSGCSGGIIRPKVEGGIKKALPQYIGPAKEYTVRADGSTTDMLNGLIERLHIEGWEVQIDPKLTLQHLAVDMQEVRYNTSRELTSVRETKLQATVSESAVNRYIKEARGGDTDLQVGFQPSSVQVQFLPQVIGVNVPVSIKGKPVIVGGTKVDFIADKASVAMVPVPAYVVNKVLDRVNPILDLSLMKFPVTLTGISIQKGEVIVSGHADFKPPVKA